MKINPPGRSQLHQPATLQRPMHLPANGELHCSPTWFCSIRRACRYDSSTSSGRHRLRSGRGSAI